MAKGPDLGKLVAERARLNRSPLYRWLWDHHNQLAPALGHRGAWKALAELAAEAGHRTPAGNPPSPDAVRKAWLRVEQDRAGARERRRTSENPRSRAPRPVPDRDVPPADSPSSTSAAEPSTPAPASQSPRTFQIARLRKD